MSTENNGLCSPWDLDNDDLVQAELRIIQYVTADGETEYTVKHAGMVPLSTMLGLLDLARFTIHEEWTSSAEG